MKKILLCISFLCIMFTVVGCSEQEEAVTGEFLLGNFGFELLSNETYHLVVPFEWTGESPVTIDSIELIKKDNNPITYEEDGINYEFFGADPLKKPGIYGNRDIGDKKNINNFEIDGKGKIILKILADNVKEDSDRRLKIKFKSNGEENEKIVEWKTLEQFSTDNN